MNLDKLVEEAIQPQVVNPMTGLSEKTSSLDSLVENAVKESSNSPFTSGVSSNQQKDFDFRIQENFDPIQKRVENQATSNQIFNSIVGGTLSGLATAVEDVSYIPNIVTQFVDNDYETNAVAETMQSLKQSLGEEMPVYRSDNGMFSWDDGAVVWDSLKGILDSAIGFGLPGLGIAAGVSKGVGAAAKASRGMKLLGVLAESPALQQAISSVGSGIVMNDLEGTMMGVELYENLVNQGVDKEEAAQKANEFKQWNRAFIITDALQVHGLFKGALPGGTRNMLDPRGIIKNLGKFNESNLLLQGVKESAEEIGQNVIQGEKEYEGLVNAGKQEAADKISSKKDLFSRVIDLATSEKALYEGMLGFFGGGPQRVMSDILAGNYGEKGKQYDVAYNKQQEFLKGSEEQLNKTLVDFTETNQLLNEAINKGDEELAQAIKDSKFSNLMQQHFSIGTTQFLENQLDEIANLSTEEAQTRGLSTTYRQDAQAALNELNKSEKQWNNLAVYNNREEVFHNVKKGEILNKQYTFAKNKLIEAQAAVNTEGSRILETKTKSDTALFDVKTRFLSDSEEFGKEQKETLEEVKKTKVFEDYEIAKDNVKTLQKKLASNDKEYAKITSDEYQKENTFENKIQRLKDIVKQANETKIEKVKDFKEQVLAKGYSEKRLDNKSGIFIKFGDKTYTLRTINGEQVLYDPINEKVVQRFENTDAFNDYLTKNPNYTVLSVQGYKDYSKAQKLAKYRQAEIEALKSLISRVTDKGKETKEKIAEKQKELDRKIKEVEDLVNSINKETLTPEFRQELQTLVKELQENIDNLKSEIADLQIAREDLLKYYDEYNSLKKQLEAEQDSYININKLIDEEQQNIANKAQIAIDEVTKAIADALEKLDYYQDYHQVIQDLILNDMVLRDFLTSEDFTAAFNAKYPDKLKARLSPEFMGEYEKLLEKKNYQLSPKQTDQLRQVKDLLRKNPDYYKDLNSLLAQKAKLIELGQSLKFKEDNLEFTEQEIKRLKEAIPALVAKREELLTKQGAKEFDSTIKLKALDEFKKIARRRIDVFEKLVPQELADQTVKNGIQTREPGSSLDKNKEDREWENMKKGTWSSTTGVVIQYKYNPKTGTYEDVLGEDGLPLFTDSKSQLLWAKFLDDNSKELASGDYTLEFHLHNPNGESALDKQITANIPADKVDIGNDIYGVIVDKNGKQVTVNGQHLFTGIHKVETLFPEDGSLRLIRENAVIASNDPGLANYLDGISPATAIKVKYQDKNKTIAEWQKEGVWDEVLTTRKKEIFAKEKESFNTFREGIKARLNKGEKVSSKIESVSEGVPYLDKTLKSAKPFIGDEFTLEYDLTGTFIATNKDGQKIPIEGGKLEEKDIKTVIEILKYAFPKGEENFNNVIKLPKDKDGKQLTYQGEDFLNIFPQGSSKNPSVLGSIIYYGRNKEGSKKFNIWGKGTSIQFVDEAGTTHIITRESLYQPTSQGYLDLQSFLATKNLNFNRAFIKNGLYFHPIVKDGKLDFKIYKNYNEFVKERAKTYIHKTSDEHPLFTNRYITYSTNTTEKPKQEPKKVVATNAPSNTGGTSSIEDLAMQMAGDTDFLEAMNELKEGVVEGPMVDAASFGELGIDEIIANKKKEKAEETKVDEVKTDKKPRFETSRKPKSKDRVVVLTNEDALKRLKELVQSGEIEKKCS